MEAESRALKKTGEILRGMRDTPEAQQENSEMLTDRDARRVEALENEIREAKLYIESRPGFEELCRIRDERKNRILSSEEVVVAVKEFDRIFPGMRKEVEDGLKEIRNRKDAIERIKAKKEPEAPFEQAA